MSASSASPVLRALPEGGSGPVALDSDSYPVPPDWIIADPEENKRRILAMLEQGDRDIAANRGRDAEDVFRDADAIIAAALAARPLRVTSCPLALWA
jgi:hypothetical protein